MLIGDMISCGGGDTLKHTEVMEVQISTIFFSFGRTYSMRSFQARDPNLCHSNDNAGSLTH